MSDWKVGTVDFDRTTRRGESKNAALNSLLHAVSSIEGLERVRVSSLDPADVEAVQLAAWGEDAPRMEEFGRDGEFGTAAEQLEAFMAGYGGGNPAACPGLSGGQ